MASDVLKLPSIHQARFLSGDPLVTKHRRSTESSSTTPSLPSILKHRPEPDDTAATHPNSSSRNPADDGNSKKQIYEASLEKRNIVDKEQVRRIRKSRQQHRRQVGGVHRRVEQSEYTDRTAEIKVKSPEAHRSASANLTGTNSENKAETKIILGRVTVACRETSSQETPAVPNNKTKPKKSESNEAETTAERSVDSQNKRTWGKNPTRHLKKSKTLIYEKTAENFKSLDTKQPQAQFAERRSRTIHDIPKSRSEVPESKETNMHSGVFANYNLNAYRSVTRIPEYPEPRPSTKHLTRPRSSSNSEDKRDTEKNNAQIVSMKELTKYRKTMTIYLDSKWKKTRRERFYNTLEDTQVKKWREKRLSAMEEQRKVQESKERQLEQLRYIRNKHQNRRTKRLSTQHVKWKYVLGGKEGDRKQYGLPSEYYTYYGFYPEPLDGKQPKRVHVKLPQTRTSKSASKGHARGATESVLPSQQDLDDLRKRNRERYDHIFATRSRTQTEMIQNIIRHGLYTVDIEEEIVGPSELDGNVPKETTSEHKYTKAPLQKRTSRLVVKDVVSDAKRALDALDETYSDDFDGKSSADESVS